MTRSYKTEAIVVKRRNFGEADRVLTVLTKNFGKIQVRAPGVRRITSRRSSHIELLNLSILTLYKSYKASMPIVTEAQAQEEFLPIKESLKKIGFAYYICELIDGLCADNQENRKIFFLVRNTFSQLESSIENKSIVENFEDNFLTFLGFLPSNHKVEDKIIFIENILEKKLRTKRLLPLFLSNSEG
ncbi:MAG: DNA repair protein RecO [Candidatus Levybacteria bacterium RIFCSPHIGHO2_12_FULL_37_9]|nr:MAG: DNA repair protein RecO [Candidatus Levybacteria bacterium RIFCSPHIGHO2_12_FULL_37_9]